MTITDDEMELVKYNLVGTCRAVSEVLEELEIDANLEEVEHKLLDGNSVEECNECGWWFDSFDLEHIEHIGTVCEQCMEDVE